MIVHDFSLPVKQVRTDIDYLKLSFNVGIGDSTNWNFGCFCF